MPRATTSSASNNAVGQKRSSIAQVVKILEDNGAMEYTVVVAASASEPAPMLYISPLHGPALSANTSATPSVTRLVIYDDLSKHAAAYRRNLSAPPPSPRAAKLTPVDVFYLHSRLLERASKLSDKDGCGFSHSSARD